MEVQNVLKCGPSEQSLPVVTKSLEMLEEARNYIKQKQQELQGKREAFSQPEDLKAVYDKAFGKMVTTPLDAVQEAFADTMEALAASAALHNYILEHPGAGKFSGMILNIQDRPHGKKLK